MPQNINWAVKSDYVMPLLESIPNKVVSKGRQEAIAITEKAICMVLSSIGKTQNPQQDTTIDRNRDCLSQCKSNWRFCQEYCSQYWPLSVELSHLTRRKAA